MLAPSQIPSSPIGPGLTSGSNALSDSRGSGVHGATTSASSYYSPGFAPGASASSYLPTSASSDAPMSGPVPNSGSSWIASPFASQPVGTLSSGNAPIFPTVVARAPPISRVGEITPGACVASAPDPAFRAITQLKRCSEVLAQSAVDQDFFYPPVDGKPLCRHYKDSGLCFQENVQKMCPATCSDAASKPKRAPRLGGGVDVPCFPALTNVSYADRARYLRDVMPLFMFQDDFDYAAISDNNIQPYLVSSSSNRELIHPMWVDNPRVFVAWNGMTAVVAPRPQRPTTKMTVREVKSVIASMNYASFATLVYMMALKPDYIRAVHRKRRSYIVLRPSEVATSRDVPPGPTSFMSEWLGNSKSVIEWAAAYGIDLRWETQEMISFTRKTNVGYVEGQGDTWIDIPVDGVDWAKCKAFWGDRTSGFDAGVMERMRNATEAELSRMPLDQQAPGITQGGIRSVSFLTGDMPGAMAGMGLCSVRIQYMDTATTMVQQHASTLFHEMSHAVESYYVDLRVQNAIDRNEPNSARLKDPKTLGPETDKYRLSAGTEYRLIFDRLTREKTGYLSLSRNWNMPEHFAEMTARVVISLYYDILVESVAASQVLACADMHALEEPPVLREWREYKHLTATNPEWGAPAAAIAKEFLIAAPP